MAGADLSGMSFLHTMNVPDFLTLYFVWFLVLWIAVLVVRKAGHDTPFTSVCGILLFEGLGAARYIDGSAHGLHRWDILFVMMAFGWLPFVLRARHFDQGGSGSCSGGGGCGGGGCGGGGCGGCGG